MTLSSAGPGNGYEIVVDNGKPVGCTLGNVKSLEHAGDILDSLYALHDGLPFLVGDFCNQLRDKWEGWEQVLPEVGTVADTRQLKTLQNWSSICDSVPVEVRTSRLSFSHHAEVAYLDRELQEALLQWALDNDATVSELKDEKRRRTHPEHDRLLELEAALLAISAALPEDGALEKIKWIVGGVL